MINQKTFAKTILISLGFFFSIGLVWGQEIGLQLYSLRNQFKKDISGTLGKIKSWNIKEIEGGGSYGLPREEFKKLLRENNLEMVSVGADFDQLASNPQSAIEEAKAFGAKYIVCFWIPHQDDEFNVENLQKAEKIFNSAGKIITDNGLKLCKKNSDGYGSVEYIAQWRL